MIALEAADGVLEVSGSRQDASHSPSRRLHAVRECHSPKIDTSYPFPLPRYQRSARSRPIDDLVWDCNRCSLWQGSVLSSALFAY